MAWILEAERRMRINKENRLARQAQETEDRRHFQREHVTDEILADHVRILSLPMLELITDLEAKGYSISTTGPDYLYFQENDKRRSESVYLDKYSARRTVPGEHTFHGSTEIFGVCWGIKNSEGKGVGQIYLLSRANQRTHLAGGEYTWPNREKPIAEISETAPDATSLLEIYENLQTEIGQLIENQR